MNNKIWYYSTFSEAEAFVYATPFYASLEGDFLRYHAARRVIADAETKIFRLALELQVAGLCLLSGKPRNDLFLPISFAFFIIDHLAMGWAAILASQFRVAYSLSRSIIEDSIFEVACTLDSSLFATLWKQPAGTGGKSYRIYQNEFRVRCMQYLREPGT